jgi:hypothetical protein
MINTQDQEQLFKLIADYLEKDLTCIAIGGTAMMFKGYKNTTKDIDIVFQTTKDREVFIEAIEQLGYKQIAIGNIYDEKRKTHKNKPLMFSRGDERFDLFVKDVFGFVLSFKQEVMSEKIDVIGKQEMSIHLLSKETLVLLKAITGREKDYEDIETILEIEKNIGWKELVKQAIGQRKNNKWILIDLEETMQKLKKKFFIKQEHFKRIYEAEK